MPLTPGTRLGPYEIIAPIGAGGMGEVYRARDTRLERSVAVKILPAEFSNNAQLKLRFEREARTISQLEHPHICRLYDVGDGYLVMELLEGETLADRIGANALPMDQVLRYGIEVAEALDKAHGQGVIHRDVKPANVMVTRSGAKLLDFGLARSSGLEVIADGETAQKSLTQEGTILGTFQYMAPEQLEGINVDHRTDIFALGALLYEMATGRRAFQGKTRTSLIAAIVASQPAPISQVQPLAPLALEHVIQRCLAKDPAERWQSTRDVAEELKWIRATGSQAGVAAPVILRRKWRERLAWSIAAAAVIAAGALAAYVPSRPAKRIVTAIVAPESTRFAFDISSAVISPDGNAIAFVASGADGRSALWVRLLSSAVAQRLPGTEGASFPFWSPDSKHLGFFADNLLRRTEARGGPVERIAEASAGRGGSWGKGDRIVFAKQSGEPLVNVSASGGETLPATRLQNEASHRFPSFLPDGVHFLYFSQTFSAEGTNVSVGSLEGGPSRPLLRADAAAIWSATGHVLFVRDGVLRARRFDPVALEFEGEAIPLTEGIQSSSNFGFANFSASDTGTLTFVSGGAINTRMAWYDRGGKEIAALAQPNEYYDPRLSPDGKSLAYCAQSSVGKLDIFRYDMARGVSTRFTFGKADEWGPVWSPDGKTIAFTSFESGAGNIHLKPSNGTGAERSLIKDAARKVLSDWPREDILLYHVLTPKGSWDIMVYSFRDGRSRTFLSTPFAEMGARVSPNGKWVVYTSGESGRPEIYVRSFAEGTDDGKWQVSSAGGVLPSWAPDGSEIYFAGQDRKLWSAPVRETPHSFTVDAAQVLLPMPMRFYSGLTRAQYATSDGRQFVMNVTPDDSGVTTTVTLVQNWEQER